jgi:hypothetical protein
MLMTNEGCQFGVRNVSLRQGRAGMLYDNGYYLIIKSYSSVVKFTTKAEFH